MSGIVNQTGARSGVIGTIVGTPSGGAWNHLLTIDVDDDANATFSSTYITSTYNYYKILVTNYVPATNNTHLYVLVTTDNSTYVTSDYINISSYVTKDGSAVWEHSPDELKLLHALALWNNATAGSFAAEVTLFNPSSTQSSNFATMNYSQIDNNGYHRSGYATGSYKEDTGVAVNGIRFQQSSGNITTGKLALYGISS